MDSLSGPRVDLSIERPLLFVFWVLVLGLGVRVILALLRAIMLWSQDEESSFAEHAWRVFVGFHPNKNTADYWYPYFIGIFELAGYAFCIASSAWAAIGAWIGLKTLAQWKLWDTERPRFNLFLIGNLLVIAAAFFWLAPMVSISESPPTTG